jgi:oxygen-independent coproporphyrinogen-3 oxidase
LAQLPLADPAPTDGILPEQASVGSSQRSFHAYVHVPFCSVRCGYCDFNTYTASELKGFRQDEFVGRFQQELAFSEKVLDESRVEKRALRSVFFGGGTPTQLPPSDLVTVLHSLAEAYGLADSVEVTTEANPDSVNYESLQQLSEGGFTRVSFGMQSAVPSVLKTLERTHDPENVPMAVQSAKDAGLKTSVDLIYGAPGETLDDWKRSVEAAIALDTDHISAYALIVEPGTKLARQIASGLLGEPDEDLEADKYEFASSAFSSTGFEWYELSNFAKSASDESVHNLAYWTGQDWWGFGPGAHSHVGGVRWWNAKHPTSYAKPLSESISPAVGRETLDDHTRAVERVMLEIRLRKGLAVETLRQANESPSAIIASLIADGLIEPRAAFEGRLVLTLTGRLLADAVVKRLLP